MNRRKFIVLTFTVTGILAGLLIMNSVFAKEKSFLKEEHQEQEEVLRYTSPYLPDSLTFCGQPLPLEDLQVREALDRELTQNAYFHSHIILNLKRAYRYFPVIDSILKANNVPGDLKYLCIAESNLTQTVSSAKAAGFWQFIESTGKSYGLEIKKDVDERFHIEKSTEAACKYLRFLYRKFNNNWFLAAAAYNMGEAGLQKTLSSQQEEEYWNLWLNQETSRYLYRILSYKLIFENPEKYHFHLRKIDLYPPLNYIEIIVDSNISSLYQFAVDHHISYKTLKENNYWLRDTALLVHGKTYRIKIPVNAKKKYTDYFTEANPYTVFEGF